MTGAIHLRATAVALSGRRFFTAAHQLRER
jgi:hypothetical protein